jgi:hypothetical protein
MRHEKPSRVPGFGQSDPTDGRPLLDWESRYPAPARGCILRESIYLGVLLFAIPSLMVCIWLDFPKHLLSLTDATYLILKKYGFAWLAGTLGGTLFDLKWLYHTVARQLWHMDRRLWRIFTPHISGGLAFAAVALISSGAMRIFDTHAMNSISLVTGISFLVGYFSDSAIAKLTDVAETLFGTSRSKEKHDQDETPESSPTGKAGNEG